MAVKLFNGFCKPLHGILQGRLRGRNADSILVGKIFPVGRGAIMTYKSCATFHSTVWNKKIISILLFWLDFFRQSQYQNRKCWRCLPCEAFFYAQQRAVALRTAPRWRAWWPQCCARANFGGSKSPAFYWWFHHCCSCSFLRVFVQDSPRRTHIIRLKMVGQAGPEVCQNCTVKCTSIIMPLGSR